MTQKITVTVPRDHTKGATVEVEGCPGPGCQRLTEGIEQALGQTVHDEVTDEFHQQPLDNQADNELTS